MTFDLERIKGLEALPEAEAGFLSAHMGLLSAEPPPLSSGL